MFLSKGLLWASSNDSEIKGKIWFLRNHEAEITGLSVTLGLFFQGLRTHFLSQNVFTKTQNVFNIQSLKEM